MSQNNNHSIDNDNINIKNIDDNHSNERNNKKNIITSAQDPQQVCSMSNKSEYSLIVT